MKTIATVPIPAGIFGPDEPMVLTISKAGETALPSGYEGLVEAGWRYRFNDRDAWTLTNEKPTGIPSSGAVEQIYTIAALGRVQPVAVKPLITMDSTKALNPKALEAAIRAYDETILNDELGDAKHVVRAYLTALSAQGDTAALGRVQPVGYMRPEDQGKPNSWVSAQKNAYYSEPVYATPPAPQPALALIEELERALTRLLVNIDTSTASGAVVDSCHQARTALASAKRFKGE